MSRADSPAGAPRPAAAPARRPRRTDYPDLSAGPLPPRPAPVPTAPRPPLPRPPCPGPGCPGGRPAAPEQLRFPWSTWPGWTDRYTFAPTNTSTVAATDPEGGAR